MNKTQRKKVMIPTYPIGESEELPIFFEKRPYQGASGKLYPIPYTLKISDDKINREYDLITLENDYVKVELLPELGGKIHSAYDKTSDYDFIYHNKVIKPAMVGLAGPWVSGGIEFNWPQHHRPTTFMPVDATVDQKGVAYMGEVDYFHNMKGMAAISLDEGRSYVKADITVYNSSPTAHPFMWWANLAVEVNDDYKIVFPPDVEYVNDHDRRAVLKWPVAEGVYNTARPFDYGKGTDIHAFNAVKVPSSFMIARGQSDAEFVCGYDSGKNCGVVTIANRYIAPGKKLWTWGDGKFGAKWCSNLTDDGSKYVELMTGCYTDNQPDFTWIAPYETKKFEQYWYPIKDIGEVKNANLDGAVNMEEREGGVFVGFYATGAFKNCRVVLTGKGGTVFEETADVSPEKTFVKLVKTEEKIKDLFLFVKGENGKVLICYRQTDRGQKTPIEPRKPALSPSEIKTCEELYINGLHLTQYKHFAYRAEDYFLEALKRDSKDVRNNEAMGDFFLERGEFEKAAEHYTKALERLTLRNPNPYDTEPYYKRALCRFYQGEYEKAYENAYACIWSYPQRSAGYYLLAKLESLKGNRDKAVEMLDLSLQTNADHLWAKYMRELLLSGKAPTFEEDPLFTPDFSRERHALNFAIELSEFGLYETAEEILKQGAKGATAYYHLAYLAKKRGDKAAEKAYVQTADACPWEREFPSRKESLAVLKSADTPMSNYYLGCVYYNFESYEKACAAWEKTVAAIEFGPAYRNLALGYYDHLNKKDEALSCMEKAVELLPQSDRAFFELTKLYKALNKPATERIALYESNLKLMERSDACTLDYSVLLTVTDQYEKAKEVLSSHRFHTYEGGEGSLTLHHTWLQWLMAQKLMKKGEVQKAVAALKEGLEFPENYGEESNYFVNNAPTYLALYECYKKLGEEKEAERTLKCAFETKGAPTLHSYYQCLAYQAVGEEKKARALFEKMMEMGKTRKQTATVDDYYGVGAPAYPPFGYDIVKAHEQMGDTMEAFGSLAAGDKKRAEELANAMQKRDSADFSLYLLKKELYD